MKTLITIACLVSLIFLTACGEDDQSAEKTPVRIAFAPSALQGEEPYTLTVTATGEGMKEMTAEATFTGKQASVEFPAIPSGTDRMFTVEVKDKNGIVLYSGTTAQSLVPGKPATVSIPTTRMTIPVTVKVATSEISLGESYPLTVTITGEGMEEMKAETTFTGKNAQIDLPSVPSGSNRTFTVEVKDKNGIVLYSGTATQSLVPGKPVTVSIPITLIPQGMVLIPAGEFQMGSNDGGSYEKPVHTVYLDAFYMDKYEVTVGQYKKFIQATGHRAPNWSRVSKYSPTDSHPIVYVSWNDAQAYAKWVGKRLPTEAEWEKADRGGLVGKKYPWGDEAPNAGGKYRANYNPGSYTEDGYEYCAPVGSFPPNGYGLYDMAGNVSEWCADWYDKNYYSFSPRKNPRGPASGQYRVIRGGSWVENDSDLRAADRPNYLTVPSLIISLIGFRSCVSQDVTP